MAFDEQISAMTLKMETDGEPMDGVRAVAHVLVNRFKSGRWGPTLAAVCLWSYQFSGWNTTDHNRVRVASMSNDKFLVESGVLRNILAGNDADLTDGALYYYNPDLVKPNWDFSKLQQTGKFGHHVFFKELV